MGRIIEGAAAKSREVTRSTAVATQLTPGAASVLILNRALGTRWSKGELVAVVLDLYKEKRRMTARRGFESWSRKFSQALDEDSSLTDLSDPAIGSLIQSDPASSMLLYELIMGFLGLGRGAKFFDLDRADRIAVTDIALFLLDQLRFEAMRRLAWVEESAFSGKPILDLVEQFSAIDPSSRNRTPFLLPSHPRHAEFMQTFEGDRAVFLRRMIPEAIEQFQTRCKDSGGN